MIEQLFHFQAYLQQSYNRKMKQNMKQDILHGKSLVLRTKYKLTKIILLSGSGSKLFLSTKPNKNADDTFTRSRGE